MNTDDTGEKDRRAALRCIKILAWFGWLLRRPMIIDYENLTIEFL